MSSILRFYSHNPLLLSSRPMMRSSLNLAYLRPVLGSYFFAGFVGFAQFLICVVLVEIRFVWPSALACTRLTFIHFPLFGECVVQLRTVLFAELLFFWVLFYLPAGFGGL